MKLLYIWIEQYRHIARQGFAVDDEYIVEVADDDQHKIEYVDSNGSVVYGTGDMRGVQYQYKVNVSVRKNENYSPTTESASFQSISTLVGENAVGKTNILSCLTQQEEKDCLSEDVPSMFMAFLDTANERVLFKARRMRLFGDSITTIALNKLDHFEKYSTFEYRYNAGNSFSQKSDNNYLISIGAGARIDDRYLLINLGIPCILKNLSNYRLTTHLRKACEYLVEASMGKEKKLVLRIKEDNDKFPQRYFHVTDYSIEKRKELFLRKLCKVVLRPIREYLFQEHNKSKDLYDEYIECGKAISFCQVEGPSWDSASLIKVQISQSVEEGLDNAIAFLSTCTYRYTAQPHFIEFLEQFRHFLNMLNTLPLECFTAFYKLELEFSEENQELFNAINEIMDICSWHEEWVKDLHIEIEWLSAGEEQQLALFSSVYDALSREKGEGYDKRHILFLLDEPEIHLHPEVSRHFIDSFSTVLEYFKTQGYFGSCQLILSTHSPFIVQKVLTKENSHLYLVSKVEGAASIQSLNTMEMNLYGKEKPSFNLIMYYVFQVSTVELHDELYGFIESKVGDIEGFIEDANISCVKMERTREAKRFRKNANFKKQKRKQKGGKEIVSLSDYVRQSIHHPENHRNTPHTEAQLKDSIMWLLNLTKDIKLEKYTEFELEIEEVDTSSD